MALPSLSKTWQFSVNVAKGNSGVLLTDARAVMRQFKTAMIGFGTLPWTVSGSSDSSTSGMDAVDRWAADTNLVWGAVGHSWIVLRQTGIAAKFEVCIDLSNASSNSITVVVSGSAGFGTTNGGTNGSTSARPTATDEVVVISNTTWWGSPGASAQHQVHAMQSTDGQCTRLLVTTSQVAHMIAIFDKPKNPISQWTFPWFVGWNGTGNTAQSGAQVTNWNDNPLANFKPQNATAGTCYFATTFLNTGATVGQRITVAQDVGSAHIFTPITLISETVGLRGAWGEAFDIYFSDTGMTTATQFDASPSHAWTYFKDLVLPWDGSTTVS